MAAYSVFMFGVSRSLIRSEAIVKGSNPTRVRFLDGLTGGFYEQDEHLIFPFRDRILCVKELALASINRAHPETHSFCKNCSD